MSNLLSYANNSERLQPSLEKIEILSNTEIPVLVCPTPAFAAIGFGMYTAFNNTFG